MDYALLLLCLFSFLAGLIDSIVGGGGLVSIPAFFVLYPHLSPANIISTNRLASAVGTLVAAYNYSKSVRIPLKPVLYSGIAAGLFSYMGASVQSLIPASLYKPFILVLVAAIAFYVYRKKEFGLTDDFKVGFSQLPWLMGCIGAVLGFYNGLVGPGTGSLFVFAFVRIIGYGFLNASALGKVVNVIADGSSLVFFLYHRKVLFYLALPMMVCNVAGAYIGSRMALLHGNAFIRKVFIAVVAGIILRFAWDVFRF